MRREKEENSSTAELLSKRIQKAFGTDLNPSPSAILARRTLMFSSALRTKPFTLKALGANTVEDFKYPPVGFHPRRGFLFNPKKEDLKW
jgi:hypothetical protein